MKLARIGFGSIVDNYGEKIYIVGGTIGKHRATN